MTIVILLFCIHDHILNIELLIPIPRVGVDFCIKKNEKKSRLFVSNLCLLAILCLRFIDLIWNIVFT